MLGSGGILVFESFCPPCQFNVKYIQGVTKKLPFWNLSRTDPHNILWPLRTVQIFFPFCPVSGNDGLHFPFPNSGMEFFIPFSFLNFGNGFFCSTPVPFCECFFFTTCFRTLGMELCTPVPELLKVIPARPWCEWLVLILFLPLHPPLFPIPKMFRIRAKTDFSFHIFRCHIPSTNVKGGDF